MKKRRGNSHNNKTVTSVMAIENAKRQTEHRLTYYTHTDTREKIYIISQSGKK